jgi:hypothetical protein
MTLPATWICFKHFSISQYYGMALIDLLLEIHDVTKSLSHKTTPNAVKVHKSIHENYKITAIISNGCGVLCASLLSHICANRITVIDLPFLSLTTKAKLENVEFGLFHRKIKKANASIATIF